MNNSTRECRLQAVVEPNIGRRLQCSTNMRRWLPEYLAVGYVVRRAVEFVGCSVRVSEVYISAPRRVPAAARGGRERSGNE